MSSSNQQRKDSEIQAAAGPPDPELESLIAPQGYDPDLVDEVAMMETPAQQRRKGIRFLFYMALLLAAVCYFCTPGNAVKPELPPSPYGIHARPLPVANKFLADTIPQQVGDFKLVELKEEQTFEDPFVGAVILRATYINQQGSPVSVIIVEADSYINARRYLENYKTMLHARSKVTEWQEKLYIDENFIQWTAPDFADRAYGLAWNNEHYFIAVTSPISEAQQAMAAEFPY